MQISPLTSSPAMYGMSSASQSTSLQTSSTSLTASASVSQVQATEEGGQGMDMQQLMGMMFIAWMLGGPEAVGQMLDLLTGEQQQGGQSSALSEMRMDMQYSSVRMDLASVSQGALLDVQA